MTSQRCITFQRIDNHVVTEPKAEDESGFPYFTVHKEYGPWKPVMMTAGTVNNVTSIVIMWERFEI